MYNMPIIKSRKTGGGLVEQTYFIGTDEVKRHFKAVRMGVSWPAVDISGTFITLGYQYAKDDPGESTLELLSEYQLDSLSLDTFFSQIIENYLLYGAEEIYLDMDESACFSPWQDFVAEFSSRSINYYDAPYKKNSFSGVSAVKDLLRKNKLILPPDSEVREQASKLELQDLNDDLSKRFPLVEALRHVISSFLKDPPKTPMRLPVGSQRIRQNSGSWMET